MDLKKVFNPKSLAIIGVSDRKGSYGGSAAKHAQKNKDTKVYYVHPKREDFLGERCFKTLRELPETVDCIVICTPKVTVIELLREAGQMGAGAAIIYASGFSEEGSKEGIALENEMVKISKQYDMAIIGPNCLGVINNIGKKMLWGLHTTFGFEFSENTGIGIVAQSGYIAGTIMGAPGLSVSYAVSSGNGNIVSLEQIMEFYAKNDEVKVIATYMEGIKDPRLLESALREAAQRRKPVVILKTGKSKKGAVATASHTGNLAGNAEIYEAIFKKYGVVEVEDLIEFVATAQMFSTINGNYPKVSGIASINLSGGGENAICADLCEKWDLLHEDYSHGTAQIIEEIIPAFANAVNPLDATTEMFYNLEGNVEILRAIKDQGDFGLVTMGMNLDLHRSPVHEALIGALCKAARTIPDMIPIFLTPSHEASRNIEYRNMLQEAGVIITPGGEKGYKIIKYLIDFARYDYTLNKLELAIPSGRLEYDSIALSEFESKKEMLNYGVNIPLQHVVYSKDEIEKALEELKFPLVMKINSPDILHKTDAGGVVMNITTHEEAVRAFDNIITNCYNYDPDAKIEGLLIQEMVPKGMEMIIGVNSDDTFGPFILVGMGGVFVELFKDVALYPAPLNKHEASMMLKSLKSYKLLKGYRGGLFYDIEALEDLIVKISDYAVENKDNLKELDLNPVFVYERGKGLCAVDALLINKG